MECDICCRALGAKLPCLCRTCACSTLYQSRIDHAEALLERARLAGQVEAIVQPSEATSGQSIALSGALIDVNEVVKHVGLERLRAETSQAQARVQEIAEKADILRLQMTEARKMLADRKAELKRRRSDLESETHKLDERRAKGLEALQKSMQRTEQSWNRVHLQTVQGRGDLCREAADLAGLKQRRRRLKDGSLREDYTIGGVGVVDLRDLNSATPNQISASLTNIVRLVVLVSGYLHLRLPAEITMPHKDYPLPTIFHPSSSYLGKEVPFPGSTPSHSSSNSPAMSRALDQRPLPRPRTLYVDRKLPVLAKEDPTAYSIFIEGITLLAWDVAWLCQTQGMAGYFTTWEDICPIGKNLHELLVARLQPPKLRRNPSSKDAVGKISAAVAAATASSKNSAASAAAQQLPTGFGQFSHGTAHSFLGTSSGAENLRGWKWQNHVKLLLDKVKTNLVAEMQGAEWEVLDEREFDADHARVDEEPVLVGPRRREKDSLEAGSAGQQQSPATLTKAGGSDTPAGAGGDGKIRGVNGWMKLKVRAGETGQ